MHIFDLFEARRNPEVNTGMRANRVLEQIEPFFLREDAFISIVSVRKIGINPSSHHDSTPSAIYCYPLSSTEICDQFVNNKLPYVNWAKHVALVIEKPGLKKLSSEMTEDEIEEGRGDLDSMMFQMVEPDIWIDVKEEAAKTAKAETGTGYLYQETRAAAAILTARLELKTTGRTISGQRISDPDKYFSVYEAGDFLDHMYSQDSLTRQRVWNSLLRRLGYDAIADYGTKFIFNVEPYQTGFLHKGCIQSYQIFDNGRSGVHTKKTTIQSAAHLFRLIHERKLSTADALEFMKAMLEGWDVAPSKACKFSAYESDIRLSEAQVRETLYYLERVDPAYMKDWFARIAMLRKFSAVPTTKTSGSSTRLSQIGLSILASRSSTDPDPRL